MYRTVPYTKYIYRTCNINNIAMYVYLNNFHSKHLRSCRLPTFVLTWSDCKTFINMYICAYVCRELSCKQLIFQNHNVLFYTTVYCMYNYFTAHLDQKCLFHRRFPWCWRWWTQQSDIARSNFSICLIVSRVLSSR